jgi:tetratricopeptide (TPR) repeat protein
MIQPPPELLKNTHFVRYYKIWNRNKDSIVFVALAEICRSSGHLDEARRICENGLRRNPEPVSGRLTLAKIYWDLGEKNKALPLLEGILQEVPNHQEAQGLIWKIRPEAKKKVAPALMETCSMAQILSDQGEKEMALNILEKLLSNNPKDSRAFQLKEKLCQAKS